MSWEIRQGDALDRLREMDAGGRVSWGVRLGDCVEVMAAMSEASVDAVVCDPPYGLEFMGKDWDRLGGAQIRQPSERDRGPGAAHNGSTSLVARNLPDAYVAGARMQEWHEAWAREALRVLKPGGHLLAFGGTRTYHRLACAVEDAGFEVRDTIAYMYGSGFPKSLDVSKAIDKAAGADREVVGTREYAGGHVQRTSEDKLAPPIGTFVRAQDRRDVSAPATDAARVWEGWGTALKPAYEPVVVARKPLVGTVAANVLRHGTGALNVDECRIGMTDEDRERTATRNRHAEWGSGARGNAVYGEEKRTRGEGDWNPAGRWPANVVLSHSEGCRLVGERRVAGDGHFPAARGASGYGSGVEGSNGGGLRGQEGLEERFLAGELVEVWECVEGCAVRMLDEQTGQRRSAGVYEKGARGVGEKQGAASIPIDGLSSASYADEGGASRFFYTAKASRAERDAGLREGLPRARRRRKRYQQDAADRWWPRARNRHPTVKPIDLMRWLVRLVTPPGGRVLDPFCGSGTTGCAAVLEGFEFVGVERDPEYVAIAEARVRFWVEHPTGLAVEAALEGEARRGRARDAGQLGLGF